jgi:molybdopterin molybdotransferase
MLSVPEALESILRHAEVAPPGRVPLAEALGLVLAEPIVADVDSPPFDKALMDGYAVLCADVETGTAELDVLEEITAGRVPTRPVSRGQATRIMTGAPIPEGSDVVIRVEDTTFDPATGRVRIAGRAPNPGQNIQRRGTNLKVGESVLPTGRLLRPQELGCLAELGRAEILVRPRPRVAILATGDELVPVAAVPGPGQIRNSNETLLVAQVRRAGAEPVALGVARDEPAELAAAIRRGLDCDLLLLSGGVSAGTLDLVPRTLAECGARQVFHKVRVKPGQPLWFGLADRPAPRLPCLIFGLPGNPVSSLVCFELFARTALRSRMGIVPALPTAVPARIAEDRLARGDRPTYHPARLEFRPQGAWVRLADWHGSSDLRATVEADAMAVLPAGELRLRKGDAIDVIPWDPPACIPDEA